MPRAGRRPTAAPRRRRRRASACGPAPAGASPSPPPRARRTARAARPAWRCSGGSAAARRSARSRTRPPSPTTTASGSTAWRRAWNHAKASPIGTPSDERLAQGVAEVLRGPVGHVGERAAAVVGDREVGRAVQGVQRVAGDDPVRGRPDQRRGRGQRDGERARSRVRAARARSRARRGRRAPTPPGAAAPRPRAATSTGTPRARPPRLQQHRADHERRERHVLVGEQRVALHRGAREHHERGDDARPTARTAPRRARYAS